MDSRPSRFRFMILDPGHFHAALVQKHMYPDVDGRVHIYAPDGPDVRDHIERVASFNIRPQRPTSWENVLHAGPNYLDQMLRERPGNLVVIAGNNRLKMKYVKAAVDAGIHVLSDKPMCIDSAGWDLLKSAFQSAGSKGVLLYDIMTERFEITSILQREILRTPEIFGEIQSGSMDRPAVIKESIHHLVKTVAGKPLRRPPWYFDTLQQGEGIVDVTTHLVDLVMWICFPGQIINYSSDIKILKARRWATRIGKGSFLKVTGLADFPDYLDPRVAPDGALDYFCNGDLVYALNGTHVKLSVIWNLEAAPGSGDTHESRIRGSRADIVIHQGSHQSFVPELYLEPVGGAAAISRWESTVSQSFQAIEERYPGVRLKRCNRHWQVLVPSAYRVGHEAHFSQVTERYLRFLSEGKLPDWEVPNMLAKYYTTTQALLMAKDAG